MKRTGVCSNEAVPAGPVVELQRYHYSFAVQLIKGTIAYGLE